MAGHCRPIAAALGQVTNGVADMRLPSSANPHRTALHFATRATQIREKFGRLGALAAWRSPAFNTMLARAMSSTSTSSSAEIRIEPDTAENLEATTEEELLPLYRTMLAIRRMEEASAKAYSVGKIGGFLHLAIGQEAVCTGAVAALRPEDYVTATYREHGHIYARGISSRAILAEMWGKKTGVVKGLGG